MEPFFPNITIAGLMRKLDIEENLNVACSAKTIYRDIQTLKNDFNAPIEFDPSRNGYFLTEPDWKFPGISLEWRKWWPMVRNTTTDWRPAPSRS